MRLRPVHTVRPQRRFATEQAQKLAASVCIELQSTMLGLAWVSKIQAQSASLQRNILKECWGLHRCWWYMARLRGAVSAVY